MISECAGATALHEVLQVTYDDPDSDFNCNHISIELCYFQANVPS